MPVSVCRAGTDKNPRHPFTPFFQQAYSSIQQPYPASFPAYIP